MIDHSYEQVFKGLPKKVQEEINKSWISGTRIITHKFIQKIKTDPVYYFNSWKIF
jgi:hypothetical protein